MPEENSDEASKINEADGGEGVSQEGIMEA